jgi:chromosomal replication initiation ATPase DnaA
MTAPTRPAVSVGAILLVVAEHYRLEVDDLFAADTRARDRDFGTSTARRARRDAAYLLHRYAALSWREVAEALHRSPNSATHWRSAARRRSAAAVQMGRSL